MIFFLLDVRDFLKIWSLLAVLFLFFLHSHLFGSQFPLFLCSRCLLLLFFFFFCLFSCFVDGREYIGRLAMAPCLRFFGLTISSLVVGHIRTFLKVLGNKSVFSSVSALLFGVVIPNISLIGNCSSIYYCWLAFDSCQLLVRWFSDIQFNVPPQIINCCVLTISNPLLLLIPY